MSTITKVAIAGATGNLGPSVLNALLAAGFTVTALTRHSSKHTFPSGVKVVPVDYDSLTELTNALRGQDAVVSTLDPVLVSAQTLLVKAAVATGVQRFIPSEFGSNTANAKTRALPVFQSKVVIEELLEKTAAESSLTYTYILTGPFLDWGIRVGFIHSISTKTATLFDGGDRPFSTTTLSTIGEAVAAALKKPEETKNRAVYVQGTKTTLRKLAELAKNATGSEGWKEEVVSIDGVLESAWAELKKEKPDPAVFAYNFIKAAIWGEGYDSAFEKTDNELLGIKELTDAELQELVNGLAK